MEGLEPVIIVRILIENNDGYLPLSTLLNESPTPTEHHFGKLDQKTIDDNQIGEDFRNDLLNHGFPYQSLVQVAFARYIPLLLISDLSDHTRNIAVDNRVSLLIDGTSGINRMNSERVTLIGRAVKLDKEVHKDLFLQKHPKAKTYFDFTDFTMYYVDILAARLNAGFGKAFWISGEEIIGE